MAIDQSSLKAAVPPPPPPPSRSSAAAPATPAMAAIKTAAAKVSTAVSTSTFTPATAAPRAPVDLGTGGTAAPRPTAPRPQTVAAAAVIRQGAAALQTFRPEGPDGAPAGTAPADGSAPANAPLPAPNTTGADAVQHAYETGGYQAAAEELDRQTAALGGDQAAVDQLVAASQETIDRIARDAVEDRGSGAHERTQATLEALSNVADRASDHGVELLTGPLARALPPAWPEGNPTAGYPPSSESVRIALEGLAAQGKGARISLALGHQLEVAGNPLAVDVTNVGLTSLDAAVAPNVALIDQAVVDHPSFAGQVTGVMAALASSPMPRTAVEWGINAFQDGSATAAAYAGVADRVHTEVVDAGVAGTAAQVQAETNDPNAAVDELNQLFKGLKSAHKLFKTTQDYQKAISQGQQLLDATSSAVRGDPSKLQALLNSESQLKGLNSTGGAFAAAGLGLAILNATDAGSAQDLVKSIAQIGQNGASLVAKTITTLSGTGRLALGEDASRIAGQTAKFIEQRLVPGLGAALSGLTLASSIEAAAQSGSAGSVTTAVGDAVSFLGSAISLLPGAQVVGEAINAVGQGISLVGQLIQVGEHHRAQNDEQEAILDEVWKDDPYFQTHPDALHRIAHRVADGNYDVGTLAASAGLSRGQLFDLIDQAGPGWNETFGDLVRIAVASGHQGADLSEAVLGAVDRFGGLQGVAEAIERALATAGGATLGTGDVAEALATALGIPIEDRPAPPGTAAPAPRGTPTPR